MSRRTLVPGFVTVLLAACLAAPAGAIERDTYKQVRDTWVGRTLRLRVDLRQETGAITPNTVTLDGIGHARERSPVLFGRLEPVYIWRITNDGGSRLGLTIFRDQEQAERTRASSIPPSGLANPNFGRTVGAFARLDSTSVTLELRAGRHDPGAQLEEVEVLLDRLFFIRSEPTREDLEQFVRRHSGLPLSRMREITGLDADAIRAILQAPAAAPPPGPSPSPTPAP